jgi:murein DD-endopeptidase MepM/ murein hydrolase activator NlpD
VTRLTKTLAALLVVTLSLPAAAAVSDEDIDRARREVNALLEESEALGIQVQEAWARQSALEQEIGELNSSIDLAQVQVGEMEQRLQEVAVEMYMGSTSSASLQVLFSEETEGYGAGVEYLSEVSGSDQDLITQLRSYRTELDRQTGRLADASAEQEEVTADLEEMAAQLQGDLTGAQQVYDDLVAQQRQEEEEARRRAEEEARRRAEEAARNATTTTVGGGSPAPSDDGDEEPAPDPEPSPAPEPATGGTCPVAGAVSFSDSWGEPRSGGRAHRGVDMIAARGVPIVAIYSGKISRFSNSSLGGRSIYFRSDNGDMFYYAHLDSFADVGAGEHVEQGTVIGYNGSSGNAPEYLPHLHFEWHPGGGGAVNPYSLVRGLC